MLCCARQVLAWGNSVGDLVADISVARAGSPDMAVTAVFAVRPQPRPIRRRSMMASDGVAAQGPLFNMLVGLGVAFFVQCSATGKPVVVGPHTGVEKSTWNALHVSFIGLSAILCATCVAGGLSKFRLHRWWIFALLGYYGVYMIVEAVIALLAE